MTYNVVATDDVPTLDLSTDEETPPDLDIQDIDGALGCTNVAVKIWHFEQGEEIGYHAHARQEELFYVLDGQFSVKLGRSGAEEYIEADEGTFWMAAPKVGRGHRCVSEGGGSVLAIGAPPVDDPGIDPHSLSEAEIDEALDEWNDPA